jgi:hypothetical protein
MKKQFRLLSALMVVLLSILACTISSSSDSTAKISQTQTAMALTLTAMENNPPQAPTQIQQIAPTKTDTPQPPIFIIPTDTQKAIVFPTASATQHTQPIASPTSSTLSPEQIKEKIASANILIYEDMAGDPYYIAYVSRAAKRIGGNLVYIGDAMGTFMQKLNSNTAWDLIIVASEYRTAISGDFWTAIKTHVDNGVAVIAEVWYLDKINVGKITPLLNECGIEFQQNWDRYSGFNPINYDMYWIEPNNPVFNTPNQVANFTYVVPDPWMGDAGDFMKLADGSSSKILASHKDGHTTDYGVLTSCLNGRVLFQTFSSHDYPTDPMVNLWENYITYTLTNHFQSVH